MKADREEDERTGRNGTVADGREVQVESGDKKTKGEIRAEANGESHSPLPHSLTSATRAFFG